MINAKPGYWDIDRCSWVGVDPMYVVPPLRHAEHTHDRDLAAIPAQRRPGAEEAEAADPPQPPAATVH